MHGDQATGSGFADRRSSRGPWGRSVSESAQWAGVPTHTQQDGMGPQVEAPPPRRAPGTRQRAGEPAGAGQEPARIPSRRIRSATRTTTPTGSPGSRYPGDVTNCAPFSRATRAWFADS